MQLETGIQALVAGDAEKAVRVLTEAYEKSPDHPEVLSMRGIALAQVGRLDEAGESFRKSVMLAPNTGRFYYNYAVHLRDVGDQEASTQMAREALRLDPKYPGVTKLCDSLGIQADLPKFSIRGLLIGPTPLAMDPALGRPVHSISILEHSEREWTVFGWILVALGFLGPALFRIRVPFHQPLHGESKGIALLGGVVLNHDPISWLTVVVFIAVGTLSLLWTLLDCIDRRSRAVWFVPMILFCMCGFPGISQAMYMAAGRRS